MNSNKITTELEDMKISVKMKLSALWATEWPEQEKAIDEKSNQ